MSPPLQGGAVATRRSGHGRKKPIYHIPRPPNAFILFRSAFVKNQHVSSEVETNHSTLSKIIGLTWKSLPKEERQVWYARAKIEQDEHKRKYPSYAFKPVHNKPRALPGEKRKVREVGPKDHTRCEKIAELLVRGKKGLELEAAIQEFDKNHVPEIVTRFEAPITANSYTSSSINNTDKCSSISSNSACSRRHSQALSPSPPPIDPAPELREDLYATPSFIQHHSLSESPTLSRSFVGLSFSAPGILADRGHQEFNTFSFPDNSSPSPCYSVETLAPAVSPVQFSYGSHDIRPSISIPNNFSLMDEWTPVQSSSPISNSTESLPTTPCQFNDASFPEPCASFTLANNRRPDYTSDEPYPDHSLYPMYPSVHHASFGGGHEYGDVHRRYTLPNYELKYKIPVQTQETMDFSTFIGSLPSYSL